MCLTSGLIDTTKHRHLTVGCKWTLLEPPLNCFCCCCCCLFFSTQKSSNWEYSECSSLIGAWVIICSTLDGMCHSLRQTPAAVKHSPPPPPSLTCLCILIGMSSYYCRCGDSQHVALQKNNLKSRSQEEKFRPLMIRSNELLIKRVKTTGKKNQTSSSRGILRVRSSRS